VTDNPKPQLPEQGISLEAWKRATTAMAAPPPSRRQRLGNVVREARYRIACIISPYEGDR